MIFFFGGFMVVELGVAMVWFDFDFDCGLPWLPEFVAGVSSNSLGMF